MTTFKYFAIPIYHMNKSRVKYTCYWFVDRVVDLVFFMLAQTKELIIKAHRHMKEKVKRAKERNAKSEQIQTKYKTYPFITNDDNDSFMKKAFTR